MPRPRHCRRVAQLPQTNYYKPRGIPLSALEEVTLTVDEIEAIRLTDLEGLYQADAAEKMSVSRQTLGRILESAHKKIADALVHGKALLIKGGPVEIITGRVEGVPPSNRGQDVHDTAGPHRFGPGPAGPKRGRGQCRGRHGAH
ncbi:MAG: DUF134 domain-containing protein [Sedimentisphaerales bacterium]|nr:DUF134 domain-containing protein [Sedimentisphaerales bacterium]